MPRQGTGFADHLGHMQQCLGRDAPHVQTHPSERGITLHQHHVQAEIRRPKGRRVTSRAATQHHHVGFQYFRHQLYPNRTGNPFGLLKCGPPAAQDNSTSASRSRHNVVDHITEHIGQAHVAAVVAVGELEVVQTEQMQNGRVDVVDVHGVMDGVHAEVIGAAV